MITKNQLIDNVEEIYANFNSVYGIGTEEFVTIVKKISKKLFNEEFYQDKNISLEVFSEQSLKGLKEFLTNLGLQDNQIIKILKTSPAIILFNNNLDNVYAIFKNDEYKGYSLLGYNNYETYMYSDVLNNVNKNNYIVDEMLISLNREDIRQECNLNGKESYKQKFDVLKRKKSVKNYYFGRK